MRAPAAAAASTTVAAAAGAGNRVDRRTHRQGGQRGPVDERPITHVSGAPHPAQKRALGAAVAPHCVQWDALGATMAVPQVEQNFDPGAFGA